MANQSTAWLFPGQGAQQVGMGRDLFEGSTAAKRIFEAADQVLDYSISELCFDGPGETLQETQNAQPALYTVSFACLQAARELGGTLDEMPAFVAGHSLGEYTALVAAGAFEFEEGLRLVQERGRLMQEAGERNPGAMAALIGLDEETAIQVCADSGAEMCNVNAPGQIVVGGAPEKVSGAMSLALERGAKRGILLKVSGAFHTSHMKSAVEGMAVAIDAASIRDPEVPVIANSTGEPITTASEVGNELVRQMASPVLWQRSVEFMAAHGVATVTEFGPGRVLTGLVRRIDRSLAILNVSDLASAKSQTSATPTPP